MVAACVYEFVIIIEQSLRKASEAKLNVQQLQQQKKKLINKEKWKIPNFFFIYKNHKLIVI